MVYNFKVFKKCSPNGKVTLYMPKRDFVDHISYVEPIDGIVVVDEEYVHDRRVFAQVVCTFRYGREEDEVMGLSFYKELYLASEQVYPPLQKRLTDLSRTQERLLKKLGENALPFRLTLPAGAPGSVTLQPGLEDEGEPCGVHYYVKLFVGETEIDRTHRRSTVALGIRKVQYAPDKPGPQPCTVVRKDFVLSPGQLELELTLDKQVTSDATLILRQIYTGTTTKSEHDVSISLVSSAHQKCADGASEEDQREPSGLRRRHSDARHRFWVRYDRRMNMHSRARYEPWVRY